MAAINKYRLSSLSSDAGHESTNFRSSNSSTENPSAGQPTALRPKILPLQLSRMQRLSITWTDMSSAVPVMAMSALRPAPMRLSPGCGTRSGSPPAASRPALIHEASRGVEYFTSMYAGSSHGSISTRTPTRPRPKGRSSVHSPMSPVPPFVGEQEHGPPAKQGSELTTSHMS